MLIARNMIFVIITVRAVSLAKRLIMHCEIPTLNNKIIDLAGLINVYIWCLRNLLKTTLTPKLANDGNLFLNISIELCNFFYKRKYIFPIMTLFTRNQSIHRIHKIIISVFTQSTDRTGIRWIFRVILLEFRKRCNLTAKQI